MSAWQVRRRLSSLAALWLAGCGTAGGPAPVQPPVIVTTAEPLVLTVTDFEETTGRVRAKEEVEIRARVSGYLTKLLFAEGENVEVGAVLAEIDPRPYQAVVDVAYGELARTEATLQRLEADFARAERLRPTNTISQEEYDKIAGNRAEAAAMVTAARAQLEAARLNLEFTKVVAPISGRVGRAEVTVGNLVAADQTRLTTIVSEDPVQCDFDLDEQTVLRYRRMMLDRKFTSARETEVPVWLALANEDNFPHAGAIDFVDPQVDPATGTLRLRGAFPNPLLTGKLRALTPGMFVRVRIPGGQPHEAVLISQRAILSDQTGKFVYVVNADNRVERRDVQLGQLYGTLQEILPSTRAAEGIRPGERVVINGLQRVRPGAPVEPQSGPMPGAPASGQLSPGEGGPPAAAATKPPAATVPPTATVPPAATSPSASAATGAGPAPAAPTAPAGTEAR